MKKFWSRNAWRGLLGLGAAAWLVPLAAAQTVTYKPYIELGDAGSFGPSDQMVVAWQTGEASPNPAAYKVEFGQTQSYGASVTPSARRSSHGTKGTKISDRRTVRRGAAG